MIVYRLALLVLQPLYVDDLDRCRLLNVIVPGTAAALYLTETKILVQSSIERTVATASGNK